jgi:hypothetical protein
LRELQIYKWLQSVANVPPRLVLLHSQLEVEVVIYAVPTLVLQCFTESTTVGREESMLRIMD